MSKPSLSSSVLADIQQQVEQDLAAAKLLPDSHQKIVLIDVPAEMQGDLGFHCGTFAKELKKSPAQIATEFVDQLHGKNDSLIDEYIAVGPYLNITLKKNSFSKEVVARITDQRTKYGSKQLNEPQRVVIDMSAPNIAKRMSVGHLRSTVIGDALAKIYTKLGYKVIKDNHLGDWGTQFGHLLYAIETWGDIDQINKNPIPELQRLYVKVSAAGDPQSSYYEGVDEKKAIEQAQKVKDAGRQWFKRLEEGDEEARSKWQQIVDWSMADFDKIYHLLNVSFDLTLGESFYEPMLSETIEEVRSSGVGQDSQGALVVDMEDVGLGVSIIEKSDGATIYMTRDIATVKYRVEELKADKIIYVVGEDQAFYFRQLFEIIHRLKYEVADQLVHLPFGLIRLPEGKMSTRKGRVVILEDVINEAMDRSEKLVNERTRVSGKDEKQQLVRQVAIGAIKWADLSADPKRTITFDWDQIISLDGNSAAYLQYAFARAQSLLQKGNYDQQHNQINFENIHYTEPTEFELALKLAKYPVVIEQAAEQHNPSLLANYIYELARVFTSFYHQAQVISDNVEQTQSRLAMTDAFQETLQNGLGLLGIEVPQKM